jgi:hypothetical protein
MKSENENSIHANALDSASKFLSLIRIGIISETSFDKKGCPPNYPKSNNWTNEDEKGQYRCPLYKVSFQEDTEDESYWIPSLVLHASSQNCHHSPYILGEQVMVLAVNGNENNSYIIGALYNNDVRPPTTLEQPTKDGRAWDPYIIQDYRPDMAIELRESKNKHIPNKPRWQVSWLGAYYIKYIIRPAESLLDIFVRKIKIKTEKSISLISGDTIVLSAKNGVFINGGKIVIVKGKLIVIRDEVEDRHGHV